MTRRASLRALLASAFCLAIAATAAPVQALPASSTTPALTAPTSPATSTPTSDLAARTGVPDYDVDPLLLAALRRKLATAKAAAAALEHSLAGQRRTLATLLAQARTAASADKVARQHAESAHTHFVQLLQASYMNGDTLVPPAVRVLVSPTTTSAQDALDTMQLAQYALNSQQQQLTRAAAASRLTARTARDTATLAQRARDNVSGIQARAADARRRVVADEKAIADKIAQVQADLAAKRAAGAATAEQAHANWTAYLDQLTTLGITPPPASALRDPDQLPPGLHPVLDASGHAQAGVAKRQSTHGDVLVLPTETITAINFAFAQLGKPYVWAATGPNSFDCSGLMLAAYRSAGVRGLPRLSWDQWAWTTPVAAGQEMPGDLVFFAGSDGTTAKPGHVAMVIDPASHLMIQAPQTGDVVKVSSYAGFPGLVGFGRVTTAG